MVERKLSRSMPAASLIRWWREANWVVPQPLLFPLRGRDARAQQPRLVLKVEDYCSCNALGNAEQRTRPLRLDGSWEISDAPSGERSFHIKRKPDQMV